MQYEPSPGGGRRRRGAPPIACICPGCGYEAEKVAGIPCRSMKCPKCGSPLVGK
jgi:hypothetical protein